MVHFLRDEGNNTIIDISAYPNEGDNQDISCSIDVVKFTKKLLSLDEKDRMEFANNMDQLLEIRGFWFECNSIDKTIVPFKSTDDLAADWCKHYGKKWNLSYIID